MNQKYTLHTHTIGFDGQNTVSEMVDRAREMGFDTIGISNHFIVNPIIKSTKMYRYSKIGGYNNIYSESFDEAMAKFVPHYAEIERVQSENPDMKILRGMEVDFFDTPQWRDGFEKCIAVLKPDYTIGSCHFIEYNNTLLNSHDWKAANPATQESLLKIYWANIMYAAYSGLFTWMAHLDLPKKVGLGREEDWIPDEWRALNAVWQGAIEINTGFYKYGTNEPYPSLRILKMIKSLNFPVLISDDAHAAVQIGRNFDDAQGLIDKYKLRQFQMTR